MEREHLNAADERVRRPDGAATTAPAAKRRSVKHNVSVLFVTQVVSWSISLVLVVAVPRFLGSEGVGQLRTVVSVWAIFGIFAGLGTEKVITLAVAMQQHAGTVLLAPVVVARSLAFVLVALAVAVFVAIADYETTTVTLFVIVGASVFASNVAGVWVAALQGFENFTLPSIANIAEKLFAAVVTLAALLLGADVLVVAVIGVLSTLLQLTLVRRFVGRYVRVSYRTTVADTLAAARRGLPFLFGGFAIVAYHEVDTVIMSLLLEDRQIGWYAAADRLTASSLFVPTIVMSALFPALARLHHADESTAHGLVDKGFRSLLLFSIPIGVGLALISSSLTLLMFGEEFRESGQVLAVMSVVLMIMFQTILLGTYAVASGSERFFYALIFVAVVVTIPLDLVLVPWTNRTFDNGAIGGALATIVTEGCILVVAIWKVAPFVASRATGIRFVKCVLAASVMAVVIWPIRSAFPLLPIAVAAVAYGTVLLLLSTFDDDEKDAFQRLRAGAVARVSRRRGKDPV